MAKCLGSQRGLAVGRWLNAPQRQDLREASTSRWAGGNSAQGVKKLASRLKAALSKNA